MKQTIIFQSKTASINSFYYNDKRHGKTQAAREWSSCILHTIAKYSQEFAALRAYFDPKKHVYSFKMKMLVPRSVLYTKGGELTTKVHDLSNIEKPLIDLIFLPDNFSEQSLFGDKAPNLNVDDRYLAYLSSCKVPTEDTWGIEVELEILPQP